MWEHLFFFNLIVAKFEYKYRVCACSLVVVRHIIYFDRFRGYRADVSFGFCFTGCLVFCLACFVLFTNITVCPQENAGLRPEPFRKTFIHNPFEQP